MPYPIKGNRGPNEAGPVVVEHFPLQQNFLYSLLLTNKDPNLVWYFVCCPKHVVEKWCPEMIPCAQNQFLSQWNELEWF